MTIKELYQIYLKFPVITTDSRKLSAGSIFFALKGENFDGNQFAIQAIEQGCAYAVVDDSNLPSHSRLLHFNDVLETLQKLARYHRDQLSIPVIGITGSNGKTTTKELMASVLSRKYKVFATQGNLNNHIGVPLSVLSIADHEIAIIEMGANHIGEIASLCNISDPDYGIITNIGKAHLEGFGSPEGVIKAKSELFMHLSKRNSKAFINSDNPLLCKLAKDINLLPVFYGSSENSICSAEILSSSKFLNAGINFRDENISITVHSKLVGDYNISNLLASACVGRYFDIEPQDIGEALSFYKPSNSRSQLLVTEKNKIVLDAYNANPDSMLLAINNFLSMEGEGSKLIILGDMLELGPYSTAEHMEIITSIKKKQISNIIFVGPEFSGVADPAIYKSFKKIEELVEHLRSEPVTEHLILLKGSRGLKLEKLLEVL